MKPSGRIKAVLFIFAATFIIYSNSLGGEFLSDDNYFIVKNVAVRNLANIPSFFTNPAAVAFSALAEDVYRPVTAASYAVDYRLFLLNSFGYHLENVLFHAANAALVFLLLDLLVGDLFIAFFAGLFFACHPVQTEVVAWISGRASVLFLFFYLAAFVLFVRYRKDRRAGYLAASVCLYAVSLFSKEMAVTLPAMLIVYDIHFGGKEPLRRKIAAYLPYVALTAAYIVVRGSVLSRMSQCGWWGGAPSVNALSAVAVLPDYLKLLLYPADLCAFYMPRLARSIADPRFMTACAIIVATAVSLPAIFRRSRRTSFAVLWFFITILPVSNIVPLRALMAERFLYIPSIGFCLLAAVLIGRMSAMRARPARAIAIVVAAALAVSYGVRTMYRNEDWKDSARLSLSIVKVEPLNSWGYTSLGTAYIGQERYRDAVKPLLKAMKISWDYSAPRVALGFCYLQLGEFENAVSVLTEALRFEPKNLEAIVSLGVSYAELKRFDRAVEELKKAITIDPTFVSAYLNLGTVYENAGEEDKAIAAYREIPLRTNSIQDIGVSYIRLGDLYMRKGDTEAAIGYYRKAVDVCGSHYDDLKKISLERLDALSAHSIPK